VHATCNCETMRADREKNRVGFGGHRSAFDYVCFCVFDNFDCDFVVVDSRVFFFLYIYIHMWY
jgi:hypothetical protein